jgi:hypothetical protein
MYIYIYIYIYLYVRIYVCRWYPYIYIYIYRKLLELSVVSFAVSPLGASGAASCDSCKEERATCNTLGTRQEHIHKEDRLEERAASCDSCKEERATCNTLGTR